MTKQALALGTDRSVSGQAANSGGMRSLSERAYEQLLDKMLGGELRAGTLLNERILAEALQISRTPVREALTRLESEGLVTRHAGRLLIVREISVQEIMAVFHVRSILESEGIVLATGRIPGGELKDLRSRFKALLTGATPDEANHWGLDDQLHGMIADASGNPVLAETVRNLRLRTRMFNLTRMPERFVPGCREHLAIIDALERQDEKAARHAMSTHLENTRRSILNKLGRF